MGRTFWLVGSSTRCILFGQSGACQIKSDVGAVREPPASEHRPFSYPTASYEIRVLGDDVGAVRKPPAPEHRSFSCRTA